jgi:hypothetical protein
MRHGLVASLALVTLATGCAEGMTFTPAGTLYAPTRGVVLFDEADLSSGAVDSGSQVGMNGTTCAVDTQSASIGTDFDYPGDTESVTDAGQDADGDVVVVVTSDKGVHLQETDGWNATSADFEVPDAYDAVLLDEGAIAMRGDGCAAQVVGRTSGNGVVMLPAGSCDHPHMVQADPTTGTAWVGTTTGLHEVQGRTTVQITDVPAELTAFDAVADVLYTAQVGDSVITAVETTGDVRWSVDVGGAINSLDDLGTWAAVGAVVAYADGGDALVVLDGYTGLVRTDMGLPSSDVTVSSSRDGQNIALIRDDEVRYYGVSESFGGSSIDLGEILEALE